MFENTFPQFETYNCGEDKKEMCFLISLILVSKHLASYFAFLDIKTPKLFSRFQFGKSM